MKKIILIVALVIFIATLLLVERESQFIEKLIGQYQSFDGVTANHDTRSGYIMVHDTNINRIISFDGVYPAGMKHGEYVTFVNEEGFSKSIYGKAKIPIIYDSNYDSANLPGSGMLREYLCQHGESKFCK